MKSPEEIKLDNIVQRRKRRRVIKTFGLNGINNIVPGDSLPYKLEIGGYSLRKIAECKIRTVNARTDGLPVEIHSFMGLYYNERDRDYFECERWNGYEIKRHKNFKKRMNVEFKKKKRFGRYQRSVGPFLRRIRGRYRNKGGVMHSWLCEFYDNHVEMIKKKKEEERIQYEITKAAKEAAHIKKEKLRNKRNAKIIDTFHAEETYIDNWTGIVL